jgi:hypothetical protein
MTTHRIEHQQFPLKNAETASMLCAAPLSMHDKKIKPFKMATMQPPQGERLFFVCIENTPSRKGSGNH